MGSARTAPNPQFEENFKKDMEGIKDLPEDKRGMAFATSLLTGAAGSSGIMGHTGGIIKPSASASIKAPEPTPDPSMQMFVGGGLESDEDFSRRTGLTKVDPTTEERIKDLEVVKDDLLA